MHPPSFSRTHKSRHRVANRPVARRRTILVSDYSYQPGVTAKSTEAAKATCPGRSSLITDRLGMNGSPSKRVLTETTLGSRSVADGSTRNDG